MDSTIRKIDEIIEEESLLKHRFYQMWSAGELTKESLAGYSREYFQLVKAVPSFMTPIIERAPAEEIDELVANQLEEQEHIEPWGRFAASLDVTDLDHYQGLPKTRQAVEELSALMGDYEGGSCAMYALEKEIPKISHTKLDGLAEFYGITDSGATEYFELHATADIRHAASWRQILARSTESDRLVEIATKSMAAQNLLLDSCHEAYC